MKKIKMILLALATFGLVISFCGCQQTQETLDTNTTTVEICQGYSIADVGLKFDNIASSVYVTENNFVSNTTINGEVTEVYGKSIKDDVMLTVLQSYYKEDLQNSEVYISGKTYTQEEMNNSEYFTKVYETQDVVVYDITSLIIQESVEQRIISTGVEIQEVSTLIEKYSETMDDFSSNIVEIKTQTKSTETETESKKVLV